MTRGKSSKIHSYTLHLPNIRRRSICKKLDSYIVRDRSQCIYPHARRIVDLGRLLLWWPETLLMRLPGDFFPLAQRRIAHMLDLRAMAFGA
jgi:hypothetical protein